MNIKLSDIIKIGDFMEKGYGILDFSFMAIQIIGIFIAIIGGLIATKILSINSEKEELSEKINRNNKKIAHLKKRLNQTNAENEKVYKEDEYTEMIDYLFNQNEDYNLEIYDNIHISSKQRQAFYDYIINVIKKNIDEIKKSDVDFEQFVKKVDLDKQSLEYKILDYILELYRENIEVIISESE